MSAISKIDELIAKDGAFSPYWGWHDDHRAADGTDAYKPALQQVRAEYAEFIDVLARELPDRRYRCLQLGMGHCDASHAALFSLFPSRTVTIDYRVIAVNDDHRVPGENTASHWALEISDYYALYDLLFIDADHTFAGVQRDYCNYASFVRPGGIIAFHDALPREQYPEVEVWRYLRTFEDNVNYIGDEVGIAWLRKR